MIAAGRGLLGKANISLPIMYLRALAEFGLRPVEGSALRYSLGLIHEREFPHVFASSWSRLQECRAIRARRRHRNQSHAAWWGSRACTLR